MVAALMVVSAEGGTEVKATMAEACPVGVAFVGGLETEDAEGEQVQTVACEEGCMVAVVDVLVGMALPAVPAAADAEMVVRQNRLRSRCNF